MDSIIKYLIKLQADEGNVLSVARSTTEELETIKQKATSVGVRLREAFSFSNFKSSLMSIPGMEFLTNPYALVAASVGAVAKVGAEAEMTSTAFSTLVGNEQKAAAMLNEIHQFAAETPFTNLQLESASQQMLSFGVNADQVMGYLKKLGDISGGEASKFSSLALVFGQVSASGKMQGQDLMQFINAGFNPLKELQAMTGKSYKELQDMMSKGQIGTEQVAAAMQHATGEGGKFHGMMSTLSQTVSGKMSTAIGNGQQMMVDLFQHIKPALLVALDFVGSITAIVGKVVKFIVSAITNVIKFINEFKTPLIILAGAIGIAWAVTNGYAIAIGILKGAIFLVDSVTKVATAAQWLWNAAMSANPIAIVVIAIGALIAGVVYCWNKFAGFRAFILTMWDVIKGFGNIIKDYVINRLHDMVSGLGKIGDALSKLFKGDFSGAWDTAKQGFSELSGANALSNALNQGKNLYNGIGGVWNKNLKNEQQKQTDKDASNEELDAGGSNSKGISMPSLMGSATTSTKGGKEGKTGGTKKTEEIATGGTRSTNIHMTIGKFFDNLNVNMADKSDTSEIERVVIESLNRALSIATSSDR